MVNRVRPLCRATDEVQRREKPLTQRSHRAYDGSGSDAVADAADRSAGPCRGGHLRGT